MTITTFPSANPAQVIASAPGQYAVPLALKGMYFGAGVGLVISVPSGVTVNYTIWVSADPYGTPPVNMNPHDVLGVAQSVSVNGNISFPVTWVILNVASISGGSIVMNVAQAQLQ